MANTIVEYMHEHGGYRCGYCGGSNTNFSHGMWAYKLSTQDYQDLIDRGWRRSGCYVYKPLMDKMCCPSYTIKCAALDFKPSKSQKKVFKRMIRFLRTGERPSCDPKLPEGEACLGTSEHPAQEQELGRKMTKASQMVTPDPAKPETSAETAQSGQNSGSGTAETEVDDRPTTGPEMKADASGGGVSAAKKPPNPGLGADPLKPPCKKAKELRRQRKLERQSQTGIAAAPLVDRKPPSETKSIEELIQEVETASHGHKHKLEVRIVRSSPVNPEFEKTLKKSHALYHRYQVTIHKDPASKPSLSQVRLVRSCPQSGQFKETFSESHRVFAKYQTTIHNEPDDECREADFNRFLVDSPLREETPPGAPHCGYGSFHEHFLLDGQIIAVGVLDILPGCVSSVYFYYDPDYSFLSLGTYSALRELGFVRQLHREAPMIDHYYMGFFIQSCVKMRYKGHFSPSLLLCPEAYTWCPIERCRPKLDASKYSRLDETDAADSPVNLQEVRVLYTQMAMRYPDYRRFVPDANDDEEVLEYAKFVGKKCAGRILLYRH